MKRNISIISFLSVVSGTLLCSIALSVAWFDTQDNKLNLGGGLGGSVLASYFHCGDGSQEDPFVITRPKHYENLVKLHHLVPEFASNSYYFELGYDLDDDGYLEFYNYDDNGKLANGYSPELNCAGLKTLEPIGNVDYPFTSHFNGNGLCVKNFKVSPGVTGTDTKYNDIGIFGFVSAEAKITNTYWSDFTIDPNGADSSAGHASDSVLYPHETESRVGYLAGHIIESDSFTDCYVNNCEIAQTSGTSVLTNGYGYYGLVERYSDSGGLGYGSDYEFHFDSQAVHSYFANNYSSIKNASATARKTEYAPTIATLNNKTIGDAISLSDTKILNTQILTGYFFNGYSTENKTADTTYSLSTLGYLAGAQTQKAHDEEVKYYNTSSKTYLSMPASTPKSDYTYHNNTTKGSYYGYDEADKKWEYYYTNPHATTTSDTCSVKFKFKSQSESEGNSINHARITVYIYIDGTLKFQETNEASINGNKATFSFRDVTITGLSLGSHYYAVKVYKDLQFIRTGLAKYDRDYYYCVSSDSRHYQWDTSYKYDSTTLIGEGETEKIHYSGNASNPTYYIDDVNIDLAKISGNGTNAHNQDIGFIFDNSSVQFANGTILHTKDSFCYDLYAIDPDLSSPVILQTTDSINFSSIVITYNSDTKKWMTHYVVTTIDTHSKDNYYWISEADEIKETGYNPENIDIVGGTAGFYYQNILKGLRLNSEGKTSDLRVINSITSGDVGQPFYATQRVKQSIVLYIKNMGNATDDKDENIGSIKMRYTMYSIFGMESVQPSFKKGNGTYYDMEKVDPDMDATESLGNSEYQFELKLTESLVQKYCYCCLDKDGNILGNFATDGSDGVGFVSNPSSKTKIATYVLVIGGYTNASTATQLRYLFCRNIDFTFTADGGNAGSFGSVGYRSRSEKITGTIINFTFTADPSFEFSITVFYDTSDKKYYVTFSANQAIDVTFYNYYPDTYGIVINSTINAEGSKYIYNYSP